MNIEILMSTMNKKSLKDLKLEEKNIVTDLVIINQTDRNFEDLSTDGIRLYAYNEIGSSNSRNRAFSKAKGDICIVSDDDTIFVENYDEIIKKAYQENTEADIITFQIQTTEGQPFKSNYMPNERWHNSRTILKVASIEITFKLESIRKANVQLDTEFGLGSKYRVHDEIIFLKDCLDKGLKIKYIPIVIVAHPPEHSGILYNDHLLISKGAAFTRMFGWFKALMLNVAYCTKKYTEYRADYSFLKALKLMNRGAIKFER